MKPTEFVTELSNDALARYKTAAGADASAADKAGNYKRGDKRFSGIVKATKKQFANDVKKHYNKDMSEDEQLDGMALGELKAIVQDAKKIYQHVKSGTPLEAWMYKKITNSNESLTAVAQQIDNPAIREPEGVAEGNLNEFVPPNNDGGDNERSRRLRKLLEIAIQVAKQKNVDELGMIHAMNMIAGDDFFSTAVEGILPDITDKEYMFVLQSAYKTVKQGVAEGDSPAINDAWFKQGAFQTYKKATPVKYTVPGQPGTVKTLEGPMKHSAQAHIITGPKGEQYPVEPAKFAKLYDDNGDGTATPKKIPKLAKLADHDGVLHTSWGDLQYTAGNDYIVRHGANDYGAVKKDIFAQTYALPQDVAEGFSLNGITKFANIVPSFLTKLFTIGQNEAQETWQMLQILNLKRQGKATPAQIKFMNAQWKDLVVMALGLGLAGHAAVAGAAHAGVAGAVADVAKDELKETLVDNGLEWAAEFLFAKFGIDLIKKLSQMLTTSSGKKYNKDQEIQQKTQAPNVGPASDANVEKMYNKAKTGFGGMAEGHPEDDDDHECYDCRGTGEGQHEGTSCRSCGGTGVARPDHEEDDSDYEDRLSQRRGFRESKQTVKEDAGATSSSSIASVVSEFGDEAFTRKALQKKLSGYGNRLTNVKKVK